MQVYLKFSEKVEKLERERERKQNLGEERKQKGRRKRDSVREVLSRIKR